MAEIGSYLGGDTPRVEMIRDVATLRAFLVAEPEKTAYFLGDLDPRYFHATRWYAERDHSGLSALLMLYLGHSFPGVLTYGAPDALRRIFGHVSEILPERFDIHHFEEHLETLHGLFRDGRQRVFVRMALDANDFIAQPDLSEVHRLVHSDTAELARLYARTGLTFFDPYQIETGFYFGIRRNGRLVSAAGVHVVSEESRVAAIGNVATHPDYRRRGLSKRCTGRLVAALLRRVRTIVLNVERHNEDAIQLYRSLGFREHCLLFSRRVEPRP